MIQTRDPIPYEPPRLEATAVHIERGFAGSEISTNSTDIYDWQEGTTLEGIVY